MALDDQTFLGLSPDQMSFCEANLIDPQWGPISPNSSFDPSTPSGYLTPDSTIRDANSRRQSRTSCASNLRTTAFPLSQYSKTSSIPLDLLPITPRTSFAMSPTDWCVSDAQHAARASLEGGAGAQLLTPTSDHSPQNSQLALLQKDTDAYLTSCLTHEDRISEDNRSFSTSTADLFEKTIHYQRDIIAFSEAICRSNSAEEQPDMPLTGTPSDIFNLGATNPTTISQGNLVSPGSIYHTSPTTENDSFDSECPTVFSNGKGVFHDVTGERFGGPLHSPDLMVEVIDTTSQGSQTRPSKRNITRRPRMRRSHVTSRCVPQMAGSSKTQTGNSRRYHTCDFPGCERKYEGFERIEHLTRHKQSVHGGSTNSCVFGGVCKDKKFSGRKDNLNAHYTKTHFFIDHPETKGRRRRWVGRDEQEAMGLKDVTRECETQRGKELLWKKGLIEQLPDGSYTEYHEKRR